MKHTFITRQFEFEGLGSVNGVVKEFSWEEHIKDPSKTYYRCGEKPFKVHRSVMVGNIISKGIDSTLRIHDSNGLIYNPIKFSPYDLVIHE